MWHFQTISDFQAFFPLLHLYKLGTKSDGKKIIPKFNHCLKISLMDTKHYKQTGVCHFGFSPTNFIEVGINLPVPPHQKNGLVSPRHTEIAVEQIRDISKIVYNTIKSKSRNLL